MDNQPIDKQPTGKQSMGKHSEFFDFILWSSFSVVLVYVILVFFSSFFIQSDNFFLFGLGALIYIVNIAVCHQLPTRMFILFGQPSSLDVRSFIMVAGFLLGYPAIFFHRVLPRFLASKWFVGIALGLMALDGFTQLFGLRESNVWFRSITGLLVGFSIAYFVLFNAVYVKDYFKRVKNFLPFIALGVLMVLVFVSSAALFVGSQYHSKNFFVEKTRSSEPAAYYEAFYLAPHAFSESLQGEPFIASNYNDSVLKNAVVVSRKYGSSHSFGVWVVAALNDSLEKNGNVVFMSNARGTLYYYDGWSGELITRAQFSK